MQLLLIEQQQATSFIQKMQMFSKTQNFRRRSLLQEPSTGRPFLSDLFMAIETQVQLFVFSMEHSISIELDSISVCFFDKRIDI